MTEPECLSVVKSPRTGAFHPGHPPHIAKKFNSRFLPRFEFHENVAIALFVEVTAEDRAEKTESRDRVAPAELLNPGIDDTR